jgi:hypothetical protein
MGRLERKFKRLLYKVILKMIALPFVLTYRVFRLVYRILSSQSRTADGYVLNKSSSGKEKYENRIVAEEYLGRRLQKWEVVHHINGQRSDNTPSNLCVMSRDAHDRYHKWYNWIHHTYRKYPSRAVQLKKLREDFHGQILTDPPIQIKRAG